MVLSEKWQVSEDDLLAHIAALQKGIRPTLVAQANESDEVVLREDVAEALAQTTPMSSPTVSARQKHTCPQLGQPLKSPRQASSILQKTALSTLCSPFDKSMMPASPKRLGNATRLDLLLKQDTIPCTHSGRRFNGAPSELIRIYIRMPSLEASISMWIDPDFRIHPLSTSDPDRTFTPEQISVGQVFSTTSVSKSQACCLQDVIERATGVSAKHQHLRSGSVRLDLNGETHVPAGSTLRQCGINHGCQIFMSDTDQAVARHMTQQARRNRAGGAWISPRWQTSFRSGRFGNYPEYHCL